jgi:hypothetical protein
MKIYRIVLFLLVVVLFSTSCNKNKEQTKKTSVDLLTQKKWVLVNYGEDVNNNNILDISERSIMDCQSDNSYLFNRNGSGIIHLNATACDEGIKETSFAWRLVNNNTAIDFIFGISNIMTLNENELVLFNDSNVQTGKLFFIYSHPNS